MAAAQCAAMALATGIPIALLLSSTVSADAGYVSALNLSSPDSLVTVDQAGGSTSDTYQSLQSQAAQAVASETGARLSLVTDYATTASFRVASANGHQYPLEDLPLLKAVLYPALQQKARLVAGAWPGPADQSDPIGVTVSDASAQLYAWKVGDVVCLASVDDRSPAPTQQCVRIAGMWRRAASSDPFWLAAPPVSALAFAANGYWAFAQRAQFAHSSASRVFRPDPAFLTAGDAPALELGIQRLRRALSFAGDVQTSLDQSIATFLGRATVNRLPVQLVAAELILVVLFGLGFLTQSFLASQTAQCVLWRTRGFSRVDVARYLGAQLLLLGFPATAIGAAAAAGATIWQASRYGLNPDVAHTEVEAPLGGALLLSALAVAAVSLALIVRFSWRSISQTRRAASSLGGAPWWRTRNADLALAVVAIPLLAEASLRGAAVVRSQSGGVDVIGLSLPILALTFFAIAALRLLPLLAQPLRLFGSKVWARLTWWRLSRRPSEHAGAAVLLSLTLTVGLFASIYDATEIANAGDRASYATGADLRIAFTPEAGLEGMRNEVAQIPGVNAATPVLRTQLQLAGSSDAVVALGLDPATYAAAAWSRPDLTSPALGPALARLSGAPSAIDLPGTASRLRIDVQGNGEPAMLEAVVRDRAGKVCICGFGSLQFSGWRTLDTPITFAGAPRYPLRLEQLTVHIAAHASPGTVAIANLRSISDFGTVTTLDDFSRVRGWWTRDSRGLMAAPGNGGPLLNDSETAAISVPATGELNLYPPYHTLLPFLVSEATMLRLGLRPGDQVGLTIQSHSLAGRLVGTVDFVPTLYPGFVDFIVVPLDHALSGFASAFGESLTPDEVWLALTPQGLHAAHGLTPNTNINFAVNRESEVAAATADPILIELRANLLTAFVAALVLTFLGLLVHFLVAVRRRLAEYAVLEANGLEPNDVRRGIAIEQLVVLAFAVLIGTALAGVAIAVLVPSLQFGAGPSAVEPPTVVHIDWASLLLGLSAAGVVTVVLAWLTRRLGAGVDIVDEVRKLG